MSRLTRSAPPHLLRRQDGALLISLGLLARF
jgi:hypothetical protein